MAVAVPQCQSQHKLSMLVLNYRTHTLTLWQLGRMSRPKWKLVPVKELGCSPNSGARDAEMTGGRHLGQEKCIYIYIYIKIKFDCKQSKE